ncbi:MAG: sulfatase-like hydrolase/transferase [Proteobacteria bacterium]|nr:sulfatase-like hydrolase/transferase [Pseudomonadota bacterium]
MPGTASLPRRSQFLFFIVLAAFLALLAFGPLSEATWIESAFSSSLVLAGVVLLALLARRWIFALALPTVVFGGLLIASIMKFHYLTTPLMAPDLVYFVNRDLLDVALHYPPILVAVIAAAIAIPALLVLAWRWDRPRFLAGMAQPRRRYARIAGTLAILVVLALTLWPRGPFAGVFEKGMWQAMNDKSYLTDFITSFYQTQVVIPAFARDEDSDIVWTQTVTDNPPSCVKTASACASPAARATGGNELPDIVAVLEESTFDPAMIKVCTRADVCKRKMFVSDGRTRAHGPLTVHVWGGGTWTSEFALMTGLNHLSFGDAGLYAPYNLAPRVNFTLPRVLHAAGYRAIAIYPMSGDFINARNAYKNYGFDAFYDGKDYGLSWESSDNDLFQVFNQIYDKEKQVYAKQPLFVMMLTLRQHGPHMTPLKKLPAPYDKPLFPGKFAPKSLDEWMNLNFGNYLQRLEGSDIAMAALEKKLLDADRPVLLFHFGDHQPSFDGAMRALDKSLPAADGDPNFITYYMLKTNYKPARQYGEREMDLSFAPSLILDVAGVKKDAFFQANALMRERCDGFYLNCRKNEVLDSYQNYVFYQLGALHE